MAAPSLEPVFRPEEFDQIFLKIFSAQAQCALAEASACTHSVFELTSIYLDRPAFETLQEFYNLYFAKGDVEKKKNEVNAEVDDIVSQLQAQLEAGLDLEDLTFPEEDEERKQARLSLSGVQKKLEGLITLDGGMKSRVLPALASMQCEDAINQRIEHLVHSLSTFVAFWHANKRKADIADLARKIATYMSSVEETRIYYTHVLHEEAPAGEDARSVFIEF